LLLQYDSVERPSRRKAFLLLFVGLVDTFADVASEFLAQKGVILGLEISIQFLFRRAQVNLRGILQLLHLDPLALQVLHFLLPLGGDNIMQRLLYQPTLSRIINPLLPFPCVQLIHGFEHLVQVFRFNHFGVSFQENQVRKFHSSLVWFDLRLQFPRRRLD